ncbi:MAG: M23 family metallopeptidase [Deltaproteobacteria bacterium]|nr:M23 family metallopeptidase [Deltaproteobacteria bacterium]
MQTVFDKLPLYAGVLILLASMLGVSSLLFSDKESPFINLQIPERVAPGQPMRAVVGDKRPGLRSLFVSVSRPGAHPEVLILDLKGNDYEKTVQFCLQDDENAESQAVIRIEAVDKSLNNLFRGNTSIRVQPVYLDNLSPSAEFEIPASPLVRGGSAFIRFNASEDLGAAFLAAGPLAFPLYSIGPRRYQSLVTMPVDVEPSSFNLYLALADLVGNSARLSVPLQKEDKQFNEDSILLTSKFLQGKVKEFSGLVPGEKDVLTLFLRINNEERIKNYKEIQRLCQDTSTEPLWEGPFIHLPRSTRRSNFADQRRYMLNDVTVDRQIHLGLDYSSTPKAEIPAANHGRVIFAGYLGIHGNMVLIDHGHSLHSLYSHLSSFRVGVGETVRKGQIIGITGTSGIAVGEHLHFEILVNGISVNPDEWADPEWISKTALKGADPAASF